MPRRRTSEPSAISIDLADGRGLDVLPEEPDGESVNVELIRVIGPSMFVSCPICGAPADSEEHVPPQSIGGEIMTLTCNGCNITLGRNVEGDLAEWCDDVLRAGRFESSAVRGRRSAGRTLVKVTPAGEIVFLMNGKFDSAVIEMLDSGYVELEAFPPNRNRYRLALLKHTYLAACMDLGKAPDGPVADLARHDLIAARDAAGRNDVPVSQLALSLTVLRRSTRHPGITAPVMVAVAHETAGAREGVLLAGRIFVSWPSLPIAHTPVPEERPIRFRMQVGGKVDGIISAVNEPEERS